MTRGIPPVSPSSPPSVPPSPPSPPQPPPSPPTSQRRCSVRTAAPTSFQKPKTRFHTNKAVHFRSDQCKSMASRTSKHSHTSKRPATEPQPPNAAPAAVPSARPANSSSSGTTIHYQSPHLAYQANVDGPSGSGYIRVQGGGEASRWHEYDVCLPTNEFLVADPYQQVNLINAMIASQRGGSSQSHPQGQNRGQGETGAHATEVHKPAGYQNQYSTQSRAQPALPSLSAASTPALTATNLQRAASKASSDRLTSVSRNQSRHHKGSTKADRPAGSCVSDAPSSSTALNVVQTKQDKGRMKCCNCGEVNREECDNVRELRAGVPLCWKCVSGVSVGVTGANKNANMDGNGSVRKWLTDMQ